MKYNNWCEEDLEDLDAKFDALAEFLEIEFVFERVSDGSEIADTARCYARPKEKDIPVSLEKLHFPTAAQIASELNRIKNL